MLHFIKDEAKAYKLSDLPELGYSFSLCWVSLLITSYCDRWHLFSHWTGSSRAVSGLFITTLLVLKTVPGTQEAFSKYPQSEHT